MSVSNDLLELTDVSPNEFLASSGYDILWNDESVAGVEEQI